MTTLFLVLAVALATAVVFGKPGAWKKIVGAAYVVYPAILIANVWTLWWTYGRVEAALRTAGWVVDQYLLTAATMALALLLYTITPIVIGAFVKRQKWQFVALFALVFCGSNILLYLVSRPAPEQISNPKTGVSLYNFYRDTQRNCVERIPRGNEFHPNHIAVKLLPPDDAIAQEWIKHPCAPDPTSQDLAKAKNQLATAQKQNQQENKARADLEQELKGAREQLQKREIEVNRLKAEQENKQTDTSPGRVTSVVRPDPRTGKLVRSLVVNPGIQTSHLVNQGTQTDTGQPASRPIFTALNVRTDLFFRLTKCSKLGDRIACVFTITNRSDVDVNLEVYANQGYDRVESSIVDEFGHRTIAVSIVLGSNISTNERSLRINKIDKVVLPHGTWLGATLVFDGCDERTKTVQDLRVDYQTFTWGGIEAVDFKNIPLEIETAENVTEQPPAALGFNPDNGKQEARAKQKVEALKLKQDSQPISTTSPIKAILAGTLDSDWIVSTGWHLPDLQVSLIELERGNMTLYVTARARIPLTLNKLSEAWHFKTNLTDDEGNIYLFRKGGSIFKFSDGRKNITPFLPDTHSLFHLEVGELYMFSMSFDSLDYDVKELTFYRNEYPPTQLKRQLKELYSTLQQK